MTYGRPGVYVNETLIPAPIAAAGSANAAGAAVGGGDGHIGASVQRSLQRGGVHDGGGRPAVGCVRGAAAVAGVRAGGDGDIGRIQQPLAAAAGIDHHTFRNIQCVARGFDAPTHTTSCTVCRDRAGHIGLRSLVTHVTPQHHSAAITGLRRAGIDACLRTNIDLGCLTHPIAALPIPSHAHRPATGGTACIDLTVIGERNDFTQHIHFAGALRGTTHIQLA